MCRSSARFEFNTDFKPGLDFIDGQSMPLNATGHLLTFDLNPFTGRVLIQYPLSGRGLSYLSHAWNYAESTGFFRFLAADCGFLFGGTSLSELLEVEKDFRPDELFQSNCGSLWPVSDVRRSDV